MIQEQIGGEVSHRSLFGGEVNRPRTWGLSCVALLGCFLVLTLQMWGLVIAGVLAALVYLGTMKTPRGSVLRRAMRNHDWKADGRDGMRSFIPVDRRPAELDVIDGTRAERRQKVRQAAAYRDWPDGADHLYWLSSQPGVAWQTPAGGEAYLSALFEVAGAVQGLEPDSFLDECSIAFGALLESIAPSTALPSQIQMVTRVVPVDSARHEGWVASEYDPTAPRILLTSYDEVVRRVGRGSLAQRHLVAVKWPLTTQFLAMAKRYGPEQAGWLGLVREQVNTMHRALSNAKLGQVRVLSAAQVLAVIRSQQVPDWPMDEAGTISTTGPYFPSDAEFSYVQVHGVAPNGKPVEWLHRTAEVPIEAVETGLRDALWMSPLLARMSDSIVRSVSIQHQPIPAAIARADARDDLTSDLADMDAAATEGALIDEETRMRRDAVQARLDALQPGKGHHGDAWAMHITISARSRDALALASQRMEEAAGDAGIGRLEWLDGYQAAAQSWTWPILRGMKEAGLSASAKLSQFLDGTGHKEAL